MTDSESHASGVPAPNQPDPSPPEATGLNPEDAAAIDQALQTAAGESTPGSSPAEQPRAEESTPPRPTPSATPGPDLEQEIADALAGVDLMSLTEEKSPAPGDRIQMRDGRRTRTGRIASIRGGDVLVEFGPKRQGVCPLSQFDPQPDVGSDVEFLVERLDSEGLFVLSLPGAVQKVDWGNLEKGQTVEGRVIGVNKGGLEVEVSHHTGFMPAGQIDIRHVPDISVMLGEKITCRVTQLDKKRQKLVLSRRVVLEEERAANAEKLLTQLQAGQRRTAVVSSVQPYGAFADLGGVDGLIHVSELSHERVKDPGDVVKVGEELEVVVTKIDLTGDQPKIGLSRKAVLADPRADLMNELESGATVAGTVKKITDFGAFLEIAEGVEGLLHISEISHRRIDRVDREIRQGEVVQVKILSIDPDKGRISLSKKALEERPADTRSGGGRESASARAEDPAMRKLRARFSGDLKGGLG